MCFLSRNNDCILEQVIKQDGRVQLCCLSCQGRSFYEIVGAEGLLSIFQNVYPGKILFSSDDNKQRMSSFSSANYCAESIAHGYEHMHHQCWRPMSYMYCNEIM